MKLLYVTLKDLRLLARNRSAVLSLLVLPLIVIVVTVRMEGSGGGRIVLAVVNDDRGAVAATVLRVFREHVDAREMDRLTAEHMVAVDNSAPAVLVLPAGLTERYLAQQPTSVELLSDPAEWQALEAIRVIFLVAEREVSSLGDPFAEQLLNIQERSLTSRQLSIPRLEQRVPGMTVMFVLLNMVFSVAFGLHDEEIHRTSDRLAVAPVSRAAVVGGKMLARVLLGTVQLLLLLSFGHVVYGLALGESPVAMLLVALFSVFSMACVGLLVAAVARSSEQIIPLGLATVFILAAVGGCWWPFFTLPRWLQLVGQGMVTTWSMLAIHDVTLRNRALGAVMPKLLLLASLGLSWVAVAAVVMRLNASDVFHRRPSAQ